MKTGYVDYLLAMLSVACIKFVRHNYGNDISLILSCNLRSVSTDMFCD